MKEILDNIINMVKNKVNKDAIIEYDLSDSYVLIYDEAYGVAKKRKRILNNPRTKTHTYLMITICRLLLLLLINILCFGYLRLFGYSYWICTILIFMPLFYFILVINIIIFILRVTVRRGKLKGSLKLNKEGITDSTFKGIKILFEWNKIKAVVIKKYSVIILTDSPIYFFVNKEVEEKLLREIKRFKKEILVIKDYK